MHFKGYKRYGPEVNPGRTGRFQIGGVYLSDYDIREDEEEAQKGNKIGSAITINEYEITFVSSINLWGTYAIHNGKSVVQNSQ